MSDEASPPPALPPTPEVAKPDPISASMRAVEAFFALKDALKPVVDLLFPKKTGGWVCPPSMGDPVFVEPISQATILTPGFHLTIGVPSSDPYVVAEMAAAAMRGMLSAFPAPVSQFPFPSPAPAPVSPAADAPRADSPPAPAA